MQYLNAEELLLQLNLNALYTLTMQWYIKLAFNSDIDF